MSRDDIILQVLKRIEIAKGKADAVGWEACWSEVLKQWRETGDEACLVPEYVKGAWYRRVQGDWEWQPEGWEGIRVERLRERLARKYFSCCSTISELGSGSGRNLLQLQRLFPDKEIIGYDRSAAAVELANSFGGNIRGVQCNLECPESKFKGGVITCGGIEQVTGWRRLFASLLTAEVVVHMEPVVEFYDEGKLFDWLGLRWHRAKGYSAGWYSWLLQMEKGGRIEILETDKSGFGSMMHDGYSVVVWRGRGEVCEKETTISQTETCAAIA